MGGVAVVLVLQIEDAAEVAEEANPAGGRHLVDSNRRAIVSIGVRRAGRLLLLRWAGW